MYDLPYLETFIAVANTGSFSKAGEKLSFSTPAVRKHIITLEEHLDVPLFERTNKGVVLTKYGQFLLAETEKLAGLSFSIRTRIKHVGENMNRLIRIGISPINPMDDFNRIWHRSPHSDQFFVTLVALPTDINTAVPTSSETADFSDIGFCSETSPEKFAPTEAVFFTEYRITCAVPINHPLAAKKELSIDDLKGETILLPMRGNPLFANRFVRFMQEEHPQITIESLPLFYDLQLFNRCAEDGRILFSLDCWDHLHPGMVNLPVDWDWKLPYGLIYMKEARREVLEFIEAFKEAMELDKADKQS